MPGCSVRYCSQRTEKGVRLFSLPQGDRNKERRKQWLINIKRQEPLPKSVYVCENHFTEDQFENKRKDNKKLLRWNAIPTLFTHKELPKPRKPQAIRLVPFEKIRECPAKVDEQEQSNSSIDEKHKAVALNRKLRIAHRKIRSLNDQLKSLEINLKKMFGDDQLYYLKNGTMKGRRWENATVKKAVQLYLTCGKTGYDNLRAYHYPLPRIQTLQKRIE